MKKAWKTFEETTGRGRNRSSKAWLVKNDAVATAADDDDNDDDGRDQWTFSF
jgi:hypothetical protein